MDIFSHDGVGYIDWNLILNFTGDLTYLHNELDAFILANEDFTGFIEQPMYYAMAHSAKYLLPESQKTYSGLYATRSQRVSVVLYNNNHTEKAINLKVHDDFHGVTSLLLEPKSLKNLIYSRNSFDHLVDVESIVPFEFV